MLPVKLEAFVGESRLVIRNLAGIPLNGLFCYGIYIYLQVGEALIYDGDDGQVDELRGQVEELGL